MRDLMETSMGFNGAEFINDTVAHTSTSGKVFAVLHAITDLVINAYVTQTPITGNAITGVTIPAGTIIYGRFTSITLTSGQLLAYKGV